MNRKIIDGKEYTLTNELKGNNCTYIFALPLETSPQDVEVFYENIANIYYDKIKRSLAT